MSTINHRTQTMMRTLALALCLASVSGAAIAQGGFGGRYPDQGGEAVYKAICQGCHMPDAKGAVGAGAYPALAGNAKLGAKTYAAFVVIRGQKAMPEFGTGLDDAQIADVINYVRTHFGNAYADAVTADEIKAMRPARGPSGTVRPPG